MKEDFFAVPRRYARALHEGDVDTRIAPAIDDQERFLADDLERILCDGARLEFPQWKEIVLRFIGGTYGEDGIPLRLDFEACTSFRLQAGRTDPSFLPKSIHCGVGGLTVSADGYIALGVRTRFPVGIGLYPAGLMSYHPTDAPFYTIRTELEEECGIAHDALRSLALVGHARGMRHPVFTVLFDIETSLFAKDIVERHRHAKDGYEHSSLVLIRDDPDEIESYCAACDRESMLSTARQALMMRKDKLRYL